MASVSVTVDPAELEQNKKEKYVLGIVSSLVWNSEVGLSGNLTSAVVHIKPYDPIREGALITIPLTKWYTYNAIDLLREVVKLIPEDLVSDMMQYKHILHMDIKDNNVMRAEKEHNDDDNAADSEGSMEPIRTVVMFFTTQCNVSGYYDDCKAEFTSDFGKYMNANDMITIGGERYNVQYKRYDCDNDRFIVYVS